VQVETVPGREAKRGPDVRRYDQATLLAKDQGGIHVHTVPRYPYSCQDDRPTRGSFTGTTGNTRAQDELGMSDEG
jgi:hypothetical protein